MRTLGFARTTTKEIARASGYSEAMIYKHFPDKTALFLAVLEERLPSFGPLAQELAEDAGDRPVRDRLRALARTAVAFYVASFPISVSIFAEPGLLAARRAALAPLNAGPRHPLTALEDSLLLGACFQYAFFCCFEQRQPSAGEIDAYAASVTETLLAGIGAGA